MNTIQKTTVNEFFTKYTKLSYKRGEIIVREGDTPSGLMYLTDGFVRMYAVGENDVMQVAHIFKPGAFFPMMWVLNDTRNDYFFDALTPVTLWRAPKEDAKAFLESQPDVVLDFASRLLTGVEGMLGRMRQLMVAEAYDKLVLLLLYYAKNFGEKTKHGVELLIPLTHKEISSWIGTTRETASLQVEMLKKKKLIRYNGRKLIIPDVKKLEREV